jgi:hypothetical protein
MAIDPMTAYQIVSGVNSFVQTSRDEAEQQAIYNANRQRSIDARDLKIQSLNARLIQENEALAARKFELSLAALKQREKVIVTAGEAGVSGNSVDALYNDFVAQEARGKSNLSLNVANIEKQAELQRRGADAEAENRINAVRQGQQPSLLAAAASTAASAGASYYSGLSDTEQAAFKTKFGIG